MSPSIGGARSASPALMNVECVMCPPVMSFFSVICTLPLGVTVEDMAIMAARVPPRTCQLIFQ
jgi:hypothetical protein